MPRLPDTTEILTDKERDLLRLLGRSYRLWVEIYDETHPNSSQRAYDLHEVSSKIHDLQYRVMAQAARRLDPEHFR